MKLDPAETTFDIYNAWVFRVTETRITIRLNMVPEVFQVLRPWNWEAGEVIETALELWSRLEYL
jgi:hypothetical protein